MTTSEILSLIRLGLCHISSSLTKETMARNAGHSQGQASMAIKIGVITLDDFNSIFKDVEKEILTWYAKNTNIF